LWGRYRNSNTSEPNKFFYVTRKTGDADDINNMYAKLNREVAVIIDNSIQLAYFMRGSMLYNDIMYSMSYIERDMAMDFVQRRLEQEKDNPHPVY